MTDYEENKTLICEAQAVLIGSDQNPDVKMLSNIACELTLIRLLMEQWLIPTPTPYTHDQPQRKGNKK